MKSADGVSINVHDAKTHFSKLLERVADGETVVIAKSGKPVAKLAPLDQGDLLLPRRVGFIVGHIDVPDDFDAMGQSEISGMFE